MGFKVKITRNDDGTLHAVETWTDRFGTEVTESDWAPTFVATRSGSGHVHWGLTTNLVPHCGVNANRISSRPTRVDRDVTCASCTRWVAKNLVA